MEEEQEMSSPPPLSSDGEPSALPPAPQITVFEPPTSSRFWDEDPDVRAQAKRLCDGGSSDINIVIDNAGFALPPVPLHHQNYTRRTKRKITFQQAEKAICGITLLSL